MTTILRKLSQRLQYLFEEADDDFKNPRSPNYRREYAEDCLFHTIGPLTDNPRWTSSWTSPSSPPPSFVPNGPAPRWTEDEVVMAYAGDPKYLFGRGRDNPHSPHSGRMGGSPMLRLARRVARVYNRATDQSFIMDLFSNGMIMLTRLMKPGMDEGRSPFISYVTRNIQSAMEHGIGSENRVDAAGGFQNEAGHLGIRAVLKETDPEKVRKAASVVKGKYRETRSHDKHEDNPFGVFSAAYYQSVMAYADALESGDEEQLDKARNRLLQLQEEIEDYGIRIGGASTGLGQAIDTPDRKTSIGIASMDAPSKGGDDDTKTMAGNIKADDAESNTYEQEAINYILDIAINYDIGDLVKRSPKYTAMATELGAKGGKIGGKMTANELRYLIRYLGNYGSNYPGKGRPRSNTNIPRDGRNWWQPGEDPEIEPLPQVRENAGEAVSGGLWRSIWSRQGYPSMGPTEMAREMTAEVQEFNQLGIATARTIKQKKQGPEAVSKVSINNTLNPAIYKLKIIGDIHKGDLGLDESLVPQLATITEGLDPIDRKIISETAYRLANNLARTIAMDYFSYKTPASSGKLPSRNFSDKLRAIDLFS